MAAAIAALPASALAAGETLTVTPTSTQAGGLTPVTAKLSFAAGQTPNTVVTSLAPGMLGNLNANPSCLAAQQLTPACSIGTATVSIDQPPPSGSNIPGTLYLVPPQGTDAAGIEFVSPAPPAGAGNQYIGVSLNPSVPGSLNLTTKFAQTPGVNVTAFTANFTTLNGQPFTRLPSSCGPATSTFTVTYYNGSTVGPVSGAFTPTGCANLPYAPNLTASVTRDASGNGAALVTEITQAATESANKSIVLTLPKGLSPNALADAPCLNGGAGCQIGTATATSPGVPSVALANGKVILAGTLSAPTISIAFPAPFAITITGAVGLTNGTVTFANVPDVPLTALTLNITGPNGQKAFTTDCVPANVTGNFTGQSGATHTATAAIKFTNCAVSPTASGSTSGLASGHPKLKFKVTHGTGAANIASVAIGLPGGLKFSRAAFVSHKTCTGQGKKKCSTTTLIKGLGVKGAKAKSVAIKGGKLVITLKKAASSFTVTVSGPLVSETKGLQTKVKKHKVKTLSFTLKATDASKVSTTLPLKLRAH